MNRRPIKGRRRLSERSLLIALYTITVLLLIVLTTSVCHARQDLNELNSKVDELTERIEEAKTVVYEPSSVVEDEPEVEIDKLEYHVEKELPRLYTDEDVIVLTKMLWGEARGVPAMTVNGRTVSTKCQQAAVIWTALNRYDDGYSDSITKVVTAPNQFAGYEESNPVDDELMNLVIDVLDRWNREKHGETDVGRVLPAGYMWFHGDGTYNHFRNEYKGGTRWMWELEDVYEG